MPRKKISAKKSSRKRPIQSEIGSLLEGGDRRSIGRADRVAAMVARNEELFPQLLRNLWSADAVVRMRAADAAEKVTRKRPELLQPYKKELLGLMAEAQEQELKWHLAVMVPRMTLNAQERQFGGTLLHGYLEDRSSIVKTFALQGLADLTKGAPEMRAAVIDTLREACRSGTAAMKARSRKLLRRLDEV